MTKTFIKITMSLLLNLLLGSAVFAQFEPQVPLAGHDAIHKTDVRIKAWAKTAQLEPGWLQITDTTLGKVSTNNVNNAVGAPDFMIVSLGDGGVITCTFEHPIKNDLGPDFVIFENGFHSLVNDSFAFLELAFVEVSSNGVDFVRFPAVSYLQDSLQKANDSFSLANQIHNFAGKYVANWGTPFDLDDVKDDTLINVEHITHIRLIDVIGILNDTLGSKDINGKLINDPFPTPFPSSGFDLESIGVLHNTDETTNLAHLPFVFSVHPNPISNYFIIETTLRSTTGISADLYNSWGQRVAQDLPLNTSIPTAHLASGVYFIHLKHNNELTTIKLVKH